MNWSFFRGKQHGSHQQSRRRRRSRRGSSHSGRRPQFENLEQREMLAVITVTNLDDNTLPLLVGGGVSLREALEAANTNTSVDGSTAGSGADVIQFAAGLTGSINLNAAAGALPISESVTIIGPGFDNLTVNAQSAVGVRVFTITAGDVAIQGATLTRGDAGAGNGGAIFSTSLGALTIADSKITGSRAVNGGAIYVSGDLRLKNVQIGLKADLTGVKNEASGSGGGIFSTGNLVTLQNSVVSGNEAANSGGGIYASLATVSLQNSIVGGLTGSPAALANKTTNGEGGGILANAVNLQTSTVAGNSAGASGGGIHAGAVLAQNSTISSNTAGTNLGGGSGGGVFATSATLRNTTIAKNEAITGLAVSSGQGGGVRGQVVRLVNATVADNKTDGVGGGIYAETLVGVPSAAASLTVFNSIIIGNTDGPPVTNPDLKKPGVGPSAIQYSLIGKNTGTGLADTAGVQDAVNHNFIGDGVGIDKTTVLDTTAGIVNLQNNNGALPTTTETIALIGVAIDKGSNSLVVNQSLGDQRGQPFARISPLGPPAAHLVDMGAYEVQNPPFPVVPTAVVIPDPPAAPVGTPFTFNAGSYFTGTNLTFAAARINGGLVSPPGALPEWLSFNQATGAFSGTPGALDIGTLTLKVTSTDQLGAVSTGQFTLTVVEAPIVIPPPVVTLPVTENFDTVVPPALPSSIMVRVPSFATFSSPTPANPTNIGLQATRPTVGARPVATVEMTPATAALVQNISVKASADPGNGTSLWSNAVVVFDYQSPTNYKFAGMFQIINRLIIGDVSNGVIRYLRQGSFPVAANQEVLLNVAIDRATRAVTLTADGGNSISHTFSSIGDGTSGVGTINANAKFDALTLTA